MLATQRRGTGSGKNLDARTAERRGRAQLAGWSIVLAAAAAMAMVALAMAVLAMAAVGLARMPSKVAATIA